MAYNQYVTKFIDLSGQRFGKLTALHRAQSPDSDSRFVARCDCGKEIVVRGRSLKSGNSLSCGCSQMAARESKVVDISGQVFGRLTVLARSGSSKQGALWSCQCSCGKSAVVAGKVLRSGNSTSCGCLNEEWRQRLLSTEYVGRSYGLLTVISIVGTENGKSLWVCRCACGAEKTLPAASVHKERVISCGCAARRKEGLLPASVRDKSAAHCAKRRARKKQVGGSFTPEQITELYLKQRGCCANCGCALGDRFHRDHRTALADGGDNDITNIELLCKPCNLKKSKKDPLAWAKENGRLL